MPKNVKIMIRNNICSLYETNYEWETYLYWTIYTKCIIQNIFIYSDEYNIWAAKIILIQYDLENN